MKTYVYAAVISNRKHFTEKIPARNKKLHVIEAKKTLNYFSNSKFCDAQQR